MKEKAQHNSVTNTESTTPKRRLASIDIMRGMVILIMLIDHVRERFYYHRPVTDPMTISDTEPELFFTRMLAHLCAPLFVFLTGLSAWLYANPVSGEPRNVHEFLLKRGLFLIAVELTLVNFSWFGNYQTIYLQVIWAIGLSMIALAALSALPRSATFILGLVIVFGHNLLTPINFTPDEFGYTFWTIFHEANFLVSEGPLRVKVSYPVLPWIGVILLGYSAGFIFKSSTSQEKRLSWLVQLGLGCLALLTVLRGFNLYGETKAWQAGETGLETVMSFLNFTKYPPSLNYILLTLGAGLLLLALFELRQNRFTKVMQVFGSAPMFFYIVHLYLLLIGYRLTLMLLGPNDGELFGFPSVAYIWGATALVACVLYYPTKWFSQYKHNSSNPLLKYL